MCQLVELILQRSRCGACFTQKTGNLSDFGMRSSCGGDEFTATASNCGVLEGHVESIAESAVFTVRCKGVGYLDNWLTFASKGGFFNFKICGH